MNYFNKTKKKRVPKLDRPNSSSLEFESSQDLFLSRDSSNCRGTEKAVRRSEEAEESFELLSPRSNRSFTPSFLVVAYHTQRSVCVCVCVCGCERGVFAREGRHGSVVFAWLHRLPLSRGRRVQRFSSLQRSLSWDVACSEITDRKIRFEDIVQLSLNNDDGVFL